MQIIDRFDGRETPFEGDLELEVRGIPAGARILNATARVIPFGGAEGETRFRETIAFPDSHGDWGASQSSSNDAAEVNFHARRTLASVFGSGLDGARLLVDLGGVFVEVAENGSLLTPDGNPLSLTSEAEIEGGEALPGLSASGFRLQNVGENPRVAEVGVRSVPTNLSLRLPGQAPFWTRTGETTEAQDVPDFSEVVQAFLEGAEAEVGFFVLPFVAHSDVIARLEIELRFEFVLEQKLAGDLGRASLNYDFATTPKEQAGLVAELPVDSRVEPGLTAIGLNGSFAESEIASGPTGAVEASDELSVSPSVSVAQPIAAEEQIKLTSIDLLLAPETAGAQLAIDLRADLGGRPGAESLLSGPVEFQVDRDEQGRAIWSNVALPREVLIEPAPAEVSGNTPRPALHWLVLQSLEGAAAWKTRAAPEGTPAALASDDGQASWPRAAGRAGSEAPLAGLFRLRRSRKPSTVPLQLEVGEGEKAERVSLEGFAPLGEVNFRVQGPELAAGYNRFLQASAAALCPRGELLANPRFLDWVRVGDKFQVPRRIPFEGESPELAASPADDCRVYFASEAGPGGTASVFRVLDASTGLVIRSAFVEERLQALAVSPSGAKAFFKTEANLRIATRKAPLPGLNIPFESADVGMVASESHLFVGDTDSIRRFDVEELSRIGAKPGTAPGGEALLDSGSLPSAGPPPMAATRDGSRLFAAQLLPEEPGTALHVFDTATMGSLQDRLDLDFVAVDIALSPDEKQIWLAGEDGRARRVDIESWKATASVSVKGRRFANVRGESCLAIAFMPDGRQAVVAWEADIGEFGVTSQNLGFLSVIDAARASLVASKAVGRSARDVAVAPLGDQVYVAAAEDSRVVAFPVGAPQPREWSLTAGRVAPLSTLLGRPGVLLGASFPASPGRETPTRPSGPCAVSQTVPVAPSCKFDFTFQGAATTESGAVGEVLWIDRDCRLVRADSIPFQTFEPVRFDQFDRFSTAPPGAGLSPSASPFNFHRVRLIAPEAARVAEIRFQCLPGGTAVLAEASFSGTVEAVENGDFLTPLRDGRQGWRLSPSSPTAGFSISNGVLSNVTEAPAELAQRVAVESGALFELDVVAGVAEGPAGQGNPRMEVQWLDAGNQPVAPAEMLDLSPRSFQFRGLRRRVPPGAERAELKFIIPGGTRVNVENVSARCRQIVSAPVTPIAFSPGQVAVLDPVVAWDDFIPPSLPVPEEGLCPPTPPDKEPGEPCGEAFCPVCGKQRKLRGALAAKTSAGRPAVRGACPSCGSEIVQPEGRPLDSEAAAEGQDGRTLRVRLGRSSERAALATRLLHPASLATFPPLTEIRGIAEARSKALERAGIDSLPKLASASPEQVAEILPRVSASTAARMVDDAKSLLAKGPRKAAPSLPTIA